MRTEKLRLRRALPRLQDLTRRNRHLPVREQADHLNQVLRGHYDDGIRGNIRTAEGVSGRRALLGQEGLAAAAGRCDSMESFPANQGTVRADATQSVSSIPGVAVCRSAVNQLLTSVVRENRTLCSAGAGRGNRP
jgi:hypothetical protein